MSYMTRTFIPKSNFVPPKTATTMEGNPAYEKDLKSRIVQIAYCGFPSRTYYASEKAVVEKEIIATIAEGINVMPEFTAEALARGRSEGMLKFPAQVGAVMLRKYPQLLREYFPQLIKIPSDLFAAYTYLGSVTGGQTGGRAWKNTVADWLNTNLTDYWAVKYPGNSAGFSLRDTILVSHPKPKTPAQSDLFKYVTKGVVPGKNTMLMTLEALSTMTPEAAAEHIRIYKLPHEAVIGRMPKMTPELWSALADVMPLFALLRMTKAISSAIGETAAMEIILPRITQESIAKAKILPFRFLQSANSSNFAVSEAMKRGAEMAVANLPKFEDETLIAIDKSGSMFGTRDQQQIFWTAMFMGFGLAKRNPGKVRLVGFGDDAHQINVSMSDSIVTQAYAQNANEGRTFTEAIMKFISPTTKNLIIVTDGQENGGSNIAEKLAHHRRYVGKLNSMVIDVAPYASSGRLVHETANDSYYCYGLSESVLQYTALAFSGFGNIVDAIDTTVAGRAK